MHSTHSIQVLTCYQNKAHITELLRRNEEDHTHPLRHFFEPVLTLGAIVELMLAALAGAICPTGPAAFHTGLQQRYREELNKRTFHPEW